MQNDTHGEFSIDGFRQASPYINSHRGKTFVIALSGDAVEGEEFPGLIHDIALLSHLGIRLVLVYGIRAQIASREAATGRPSRIVNDLRITDDETLKNVMEIAGSVRVRIESAFSSSMPNTPMSGARLGIVSGNFVTARPYGVHDGVDYRHTGVVRRVHANAIKEQLAIGNLVLLSPLGYSITGETFNLHAEDVATEAAIALGAEKLIFLLESTTLDERSGQPIRQTTPSALRDLIGQQVIGNTSEHILDNSLQACEKGIRRVHLLDRHIDGALIRELFTRDGIGAMISADNYDGMRLAVLGDVGGIIELIEPLENNGTLVRRSREQLEMEIGNFSVIERDGMVVACAALYAMEEFGEIACVVTHPQYRNSGRAERLLEYLEKQARAAGLEKLFVFTTQTRHWFIEQGFREGRLEELPAARQSSYNFKRNSKILIKPLRT